MMKQISPFSVRVFVSVCVVACVYAGFCLAEDSPSLPLPPFQPPEWFLYPLEPVPTLLLNISGTALRHPPPPVCTMMYHNGSHMFCDHLHPSDFPNVPFESVLNVRRGPRKEGDSFFRELFCNSLTLTFLWIMVIYSFYRIIHLLQWKRHNFLWWTRFIIFGTFMCQFLILSVYSSFLFVEHCLSHGHQTITFFVCDFDFTPLVYVAILFLVLRGHGPRCLTFFLRDFWKMIYIPLFVLIRSLWLISTAYFIQVVAINEDISVEKQGREDHSNIYFHQVCYHNGPGGRKFFIKIRSKGGSVLFTGPHCDTLKDALRSADNIDFVYEQAGCDFIQLAHIFDGNFLRHLTFVKNIVVVTCSFYNLYKLNAPLSSYVLLLARELENFVQFAKFILPIISELAPNTERDSFDIFDGDALCGPESFFATPAPQPAMLPIEPQAYDLDSINSRVFSSFAIICAFVYSLATLPNLDPHSLFSRFHFVRSQLTDGPLTSSFEIGRTVIRAIRIVMMEVWNCCNTGSFTSLFFSQTDFWKLYNDVSTSYKHIHEYGEAEVDFLPIKSFPQFEIQLAKCINDAKRLSKDNNPQASSIKQKLLELQEMSIIIQSNDFKNRMRKAPFSILLYGPSSVGKSTASELLYAMVGKYYGLNTAPGYKYVWNGSSKFYDGVRSDQWAILADDVARESPNMITAESSTTRAFIDVINNVPFHPNMADVTEKGKIDFRPKLFLATTNDRLLNAHVTHNCPSALARRLQWYVTVEPINSVRVGRQLDPTRAADYVASGGEIGGLWRWSVYRPVIVLNPSKPTKGDTVSFEPVIPPNATYEDMAKALVKALDAHEVAQTSVVNSFNNLHKSVHFCPSCRAYVPSDHACPVLVTDPVAPQSFDDLKVSALRLCSSVRERFPGFWRCARNSFLDSARALLIISLNVYVFVTSRTLLYRLLLYAPEIYCACVFGYCFVFESYTCILLSIFLCCMVLRNRDAIIESLVTFIFSIGSVWIHRCARSRFPVVSEYARDLVIYRTRTSGCKALLREKKTVRANRPSS